MIRTSASVQKLYIISQCTPSLCENGAAAVELREGIVNSGLKIFVKAIFQMFPDFPGKNLFLSLFLAGAQTFQIFCIPNLRRYIYARVGSVCFLWACFVLGRISCLQGQFCESEEVVILFFESFESRPYIHKYTHMLLETHLTKPPPPSSNIFFHLNEPCSISVPNLPNCDRKVRGEAASLLRFSVCGWVLNRGMLLCHPPLTACFLESQHSVTTTRCHHRQGRLKVDETVRQS